MKPHDPHAVEWMTHLGPEPHNRLHKFKLKIFCFSPQKPVSSSRTARGTQEPETVELRQVSAARWTRFP